MDHRTHQRWYDKHKSLGKCIELLESFPPEIQSIIAEGIITLSERECQAHEILQSLKSMGAEKILGMYKSKNKRRSYDNDPTLHRAMTYLYVLSEENQLFMASQIMDLLNYIYDYLKTCKAFEADPTVEEVASVTRTFVDSGSSEAKQFLEQVRTEFKTKLTSAILIEQQHQGMRVREEEK